jgi:Meiotic cell cortex C-terminal pleckstrin homology
MDTGPFTSPPPVPFQAPARASFRRRSNSSFDQVSSSPFRSFSPADDDHDHDIGSDANGEDDAFSSFDPRRFTPTLHANLVSEILSLRRELESKGKEIVKLETSLDESRNDNDILNENVATFTRENRSLKKQMQLLEGGSFSAISEIAKERDDAVENIGDVRKRLEQTQKKLKAQEEEVERSQMLWDRDRQTWDSEKRNWERKVHVVENRLKAVLNEVAAAQAAGNFPKHEGDDDATKDNTTMDSASIRSSSAFGRRRASTTSASTYDGEPLNSGRFSSMSFANANGAKPDGLNLADELAFGEDEEDDYIDLLDESTDERRTSVASQSSFNMSMKARKILGLSMDSTSIKNAKELLNFDDPAPAEPVEVKRRIEYRDVGIQFTPPPSPSLTPSEPQIVIEGPDNEAENDVENKNVLPEMVDSAVETTFVEMVSTSCQTDEPVPVTIPEPVEAQVPEPVKEPVRSMVSISTQTEVESEDEEEEEDEINEVATAVQLSPTVPTIAIIPPGSEPASRRTSVVLPPHTKSISCQTDFELSYDLRSVAMQTEEIRVDQRPIKLPASLLPSAIIELSEENIDLDNISIPFMSPPPRSPNRPLLRGPSEPAYKDKSTKMDTIQAYPGNNDNGPLAEDDTSDIRRPFRSSSLFAGFDDDGLPDPLPELPDVFSDDDVYSRPMASYTLRSGKMVNRMGLGNDTLREEDEFDIDLPSTTQNGTNPARRSVLNPKNVPAKQPDIRRTALISNGAAAHQRSRPRSPSDPSIDSASTGAARPPPFPVPARLSSRNVPTSTYGDNNQSPTPYSDGNSYSSRRKSRRITRQPTLRKTRSAAATVQKNQQDRASTSPPPMSIVSGMSNSSYAPDSPQLPPLPPMPTTDEAVIYRPKRSARRIPSSRPDSIRSQAPSHTIEEPVSAFGQSTTVVDAIAQTMVGEWMYKYVRRRKSFGMSDKQETMDTGKSTEEVSASITGTGVRHKRWVWLAPYERAVMWSSKQPTSGPALLGKNGRKREFTQTMGVTTPESFL